MLKKKLYNATLSARAGARVRSRSQGPEPEPESGAGRSENGPALQHCFLVCYTLSDVLPKDNCPFIRCPKSNTVP